MTAAATALLDRRIAEGRYREIFEQPSAYGVVRLVLLRPATEGP